MVTMIQNNNSVSLCAAIRNADSPLPGIEHYWNPGEETPRERLKLRVLHKVAECGGLMRPVFGRLATSTVGILTWHRITSEVCGVASPTINVTPERFRQQLLGLRDAGFRFSSLSSVLDACDGRSQDIVLPDRTVVVTFDDIYDNVFQNAWPVLQELNIPATFFISTAFVDSPEPFLFDPWAIQNQDHIPESAWRPITNDHLQTMLQSELIELGAHTHTHQDFRSRPEDFAEDLAMGVTELQTRYGVNDLPFAFPYGIPRMGFSAEPLMDAVRRSGLRCGLTTGSHTNGINTSPFGWGRFHVFEHDTPRSLAAKLDGWYEWLPKLKNLLTR